jgi:hypothetical protein
MSSSPRGIELTACNLYFVFSLSVQARQDESARRARVTDGVTHQG